MFKLSPFKKKLPPNIPHTEANDTPAIIEPIIQAFEADITYRRFKVFTNTQLLITDRQGIKVGDLMVSYPDGRTEVLTKAEVAQRQKEGKL
jgi:hypothetical protein